MKTILLNCFHCDKEFERSLSSHNLNVKRGSKPFCSRTCFSKYATKNSREGICVECKTPFRRNSSPGKGDKLLYCSVQCSSKGTNSLRRKQENYCCPVCEKPKKPSQKYCTDCSPKRFRNLDNKTLAELKDSYDTSQYHAKIRGDARFNYASSNEPMFCMICKYSKHVDICHIIDIKDFPLTSAIKEINHISNLISLCKNHHWEFDNEELDEEDSSKINSILIEKKNSRSPAR